MKTIVFTEIDQIVFIKLNRPEVRNAFNSEMISELTQAFLDLQNRSDIRAVGLTGEGKVFCAGADLNWMKSMVNFSLAENKQDSEKLYEMFAAMNDTRAFQNPIALAIEFDANDVTAALIFDSSRHDVVLVEQRLALDIQPDGRGANHGDGRGKIFLSVAFHVDTDIAQLLLSFALFARAAARGQDQSEQHEKAIEHRRATLHSCRQTNGSTNQSKALWASRVTKRSNANVATLTTSAKRKP